MKIIVVQKTYTLAEINDVAAHVFETYKAHKVWIFEAAMGAGKTTFINALCRHVLNIADVSGSPTFSIINEYYSPQYGKIFHLDLYRLRDEEEAIQAGVEDALYSDAFLCLVEWPEKAAGILPDDALVIEIETPDEDTRTMRITARQAS